MGTIDNRADIVDLWGRKFKLVKRGLDENEIIPFVNELIKDHDLFAQREEHFDSLTKLAERTVVEADRIAEEVKKEAAEKAEAKAREVIVKAEEQVKQMMDEKRKEVVAAANEDAKTIKAHAEHEAELIVTNSRKRVKGEIAEETQKIFGRLLSQLDSLQQQVRSLKAGFSDRLPDVLEAVAKIPGPAPATTEPPKALAFEKAMGIEVVPQTPAQAKELSESAKPKEVPAEQHGAPVYDGEVELNILPPINIMQVIAVMQHLDNLPEVKATELIPVYDKPSIIVSLRKPLALLGVLKTLPEIEDAHETAEETSGAENKRRKIQVKLAERKTILDESKDRLNSEISSILSNSDLVTE